MVINNNDINNIQEYLNRLIETDYFIRGSEEVIEKISKNLSCNICNKVFEVRNCIVPNEFDVQEKITNSMEEIIDKLIEEIHLYMANVNKKINSLIYNIDNNHIEIDEEALKKFLSKSLQPMEIKEAQDDTNKIITMINSHISFKNKSNPEFYRKKVEIENYIRQEIAKKMPIFKEEIDQLYYYLLKQSNDKRIDLLNYIIKIEEREKLNDSKIENFEEYSDVSEKNESENAKKFL